MSVHFNSRNAKHDFSHCSELITSKKHTLYYYYYYYYMKKKKKKKPLYVMSHIPLVGCWGQSGGCTVIELLTVEKMNSGQCDNALSS